MEPAGQLLLMPTILKLLEINPETDLIKFTVEGNKLIITKSPNKRDDINK